MVENLVLCYRFALSDLSNYSTSESQFGSNTPLLPRGRRPLSIGILNVKWRLVGQVTVITEIRNIHRIFFFLEILKGRTISQIITYGG